MVNKEKRDNNKKTSGGVIGTSANAIPVSASKSIKVVSSSTCSNTGSVETAANPILVKTPASTKVSGSVGTSANAIPVSAPKSTKISSSSKGLVGTSANAIPVRKPKSTKISASSAHSKIGSVGTSANAIPAKAPKSTKLSGSGTYSKIGLVGTSANAIPVSTAKPSKIGSSSTFSKIGSVGTSANAIPVSASKSSKIGGSVGKSTNAILINASKSSKIGTSANAIPINASKSMKINSPSISLKGSTKPRSPLVTSSRIFYGSSSLYQHMSPLLKHTPEKFNSTLKDRKRASPLLKSEPEKFRSAPKNRQHTVRLLSTGSETVSSSISGEWQRAPPLLKSEPEKFSSASQSLSDTGRHLSLSKKFTYVNKSNPASFVKSELVGKFTAFPAKEISLEDFEWRHLHEPNIREDINFDLNEGYDRSIDYGTFWDKSIGQIAEYIMGTTKEGTSLTEAIHGCKFVASRGTLTHLASYGTLSEKEDKEQIKIHGQFIFTKFEGVIFVDISPDRPKQNKEQMNRNYFWEHKMNYLLTTEDLEDEPDLENFEVPRFMQLGLFKADFSDLGTRKSSWFISAKIKGADINGTFVEFKEQAFGLTLKQPWHKHVNWFAGYKSKWWIQALLANVERIIIGIHDGDGVIKKVDELCMSDVAKTEKQWEPGNCAEFLLDICEDVKALLDSKPERSLLKLEFFTNRKEIAMAWIEEEKRDEYELLPTNFVERFSTNE